MGIVAWVATVFSVLYLVWAIKNDALCFIFGIISSCFWAYESYFHLNLKFDAGLQIFYVVMSMIGLYRWQYKTTAKEEIPITSLNITGHTMALLAGTIASGTLVYLSQYIESISFPVLDAFTTIFLIVGTLLLVERKLFSWIYLVICDIIYMYIYSVQEAWLFVGMMGVYTVFGIVGFINWRTIMTQQGELAFEKT